MLQAASIFEGSQNSSRKKNVRTIPASRQADPSSVSTRALVLVGLSLLETVETDTFVFALVEWLADLFLLSDGALGVVRDATESRGPHGQDHELRDDKVPCAACGIEVVLGVWDTCQTHCVHLDIWLLLRDVCATAKWCAGNRGEQVEHLHVDMVVFSVVYFAFFYTVK
jgi:hypothetical protein